MLNSKIKISIREHLKTNIPKWNQCPSDHLPTASRGFKGTSFWVLTYGHTMRYENNRMIFNRLSLVMKTCRQPNALRRRFADVI